MIEMLTDNISHALMITGFVFMMMIVVEYFNILTGGLWQQAFRGSLWKQYLLAGVLAESRLDFLKVKAINLTAGFLVGLGSYLAGW
ncbi:MAG: hypothetical protein ACLFV2_00445 [Desulfurivibrionaceae bacterium]